jgi:hypothetical protein
MESSSGHRIVRYAPIVSTFHSKRNRLDLYPQGVHRINLTELIWMRIIV